MLKKHLDGVSSISTRLQSYAPWNYLDLGMIPIPAREYVTLERYKRNLREPYLSTRRRTVISYVLVVLMALLVFVGVLLMVFYLITSSAPGGWSGWSQWSECSQTCAGGVQFRNRTCVFPLQDSEGEHCRGNDTEIQECNTQVCDGFPRVGPPDIDGFDRKSYETGDLESVYLCKDNSLSIDVNSGSQTCPKITYTNETWTPFRATCGQGRTFGTEVADTGGSFYASSGNITSPNHPNSYPDEYGVYHWTVVSTGSSIDFQITALNTNKKRPDCRGNSGVAIYCGINIPPLQPSHGYFCGSDLPPKFTCGTGCAIVRFLSIPDGSSYTGFRLEWSSGDR